MASFPFFTRMVLVIKVLGGGGVGEATLLQKGPSPTKCLQNVYKMFTKCLQNVYKVFTKYLQSMTKGNAATFEVRHYAAGQLNACVAAPLREGFVQGQQGA